ncbi:MAG TPA: protein kinase, partial [Gemmataceae bacterium]|nr:protein kinase [Gemmataceae bacterium]
DHCAACQATLEGMTAPNTHTSSSMVLQRSAAAPPEKSSTQASFLSHLKQRRPTRARQAGAENVGDTRRFPVVANYEILAEIGRGGMGVVYKARHVGLDRLVALKMILAGPHAGPREQLRFRQEAEAVARLRHANVVQIYDIGESDGCSYLALEFVEGVSLAQLLRGTPQPILPAARLIEILATAMHYAHQQGIVHRDLKPANILLEGQSVRRFDDEGFPCLVPRPNAPLPNPKITDFGLAKRLDSESALVQSGEFVGTPSYMAPEQAKGSGQPVGPAGDVYALGAILYELLTGRPPFRGPTSVDTVLQVLHEDPVRPGSFRSDLPRDLETICLKCLAKDPARRYATAEELADDLVLFRKGQPIKARPVGVFEHVWKWAKRRPVSAAAVIAISLTAILGYSVITWLWHDARTARDDMEVQREKAEEARHNEAEHRKHARHALYFSRVAQSQLQWRLNDFHGAEQSLAKCVPSDGDVDDRGWEWHYLQGLFHNDLFTLPHGHGGASGSIVYNKSGTHIATVVSGPPAGETPEPSELRLWDARTGGLVKTWTGPGSLHRLAFHPFDNVLALASMDGTVMIWNADSGSEVLRRQMHNDRIWSITFSPDGKSIASADATGVLKIWNAADGKILQDIPAHKDVVHGVAFHPTKPMVATASADGAVKLWDTITGQEIRTLRGHKLGVVCIAFSPDGQSIVSASSNGNHKIWDLESGKVTQSLTSDTGGVLHVVYSPDGRYLAKAGKDGSVRIWHLATGVERMAFRGHTGPVECVHFSPDCQRVASISPGDGLAKVWDLTRHPEHATFARTDKDIEAIAFVSEGKNLISITSEGKLQSWDAATGMLQTERLMPIHKSILSPAVPVAFSTYGKFLAARSEKDARVVKRWYTSSGAEAATFQGHALPVCCVRFSPNGAYLATAACNPDAADAPNEIMIWDAGTGNRLASIAGAGRIFSLVFGPNNQTVAWGGQKGQVTLCNWKEAKHTVTITAHQSDVTALAFSPDRKWFASAGMEDRQVKIWSARTLSAEDAKAVHVLAAPAHTCDLAFSPNSRRLATNSRDGIRMWDVETGYEALFLRGAAQRFWDPPFNPRLVFSLDGTMLAGTNWDESISLWEAPPLDTDDQFAKLQEKRRRFAEERSNLWHLQEAELCLVYRNMTAARFHLGFLAADFDSEPLQVRKSILQQKLSNIEAQQSR